MTDKHDKQQAAEREKLLAELDWCIENGTVGPRSHKALIAARAALTASEAKAGPEGVMTALKPFAEAYEQWDGSGVVEYFGTNNVLAADFRKAFELYSALLSQAAPVQPIDVILYCPACRMQHIDAPEPMTLAEFESGKPWTNPPHCSHLCHGCGYIWRPADVPTNGVEAIKTKGKNDSEPVAAQPQAEAFQQRVQPWMMACFGPEISADTQERNHRFLEEALELVQACGATQSEAHQLVDYVYGRPVGEKHQEVGGVMVTLAALCLAQGLDMHEAGEVELARIWTKVEQIRAKQAAKPKHSPLPAATNAVQQPEMPTVTVGNYRIPAPLPYIGPVHTESRSGKVELWPSQFKEALQRYAKTAVKDALAAIAQSAPAVPEGWNEALEAAAEICRRKQCRPEFEPELHDKLLKHAEDEILALKTAAAPAPAEQKCEHDYHYFGDYPIRRCNRCNALETTEQEKKQ